MARATIPMFSFAAGLISPRLAGRADLDFYHSATLVQENMVTTPFGTLARRPGSRYIADARDHDTAGRNVPFEFNDEQAYLFEVADRWVRIFRDRAPLTAPAVTAAIDNGTFDAGIAGWTDLSTGAAELQHAWAGTATAGTWFVATAGTRALGDGTTNGKHGGLRFWSGGGGTVTGVTVEVGAVTSAYNAVASLWTDVAGAPGVQVGGNSSASALDGTGNKPFTWSSNAPVLAADTSYWLVISDSGTSGSITLVVGNAQGALYDSGQADSIASIADASGGFPDGNEWKWRVDLRIPDAAGRLSLVTSGSDVAIAEQTVTINELDTTHVLRLRVVGGAGDAVQLRVGTASGGEDLLEDVTLYAGPGPDGAWHTVSFASHVATVYLQIRNASGRVIDVDDVEFLDDAAIELGAPWPAEDLAGLKWVQSEDVLFLFHPSWPPHRLERRGAGSWSLYPMLLRDGPYLPQNADTSQTLAPSATSGNITITASGFAPFRETDVGRLVRIQHSSTWGWAEITGWTSRSVVSARVRGNFGATDAVATWRLGIFSGSDGWPVHGIFHQDRLWLARGKRLAGSKIGVYDLHTPGTEADDPILIAIGANQASWIYWLASHRSLFAGTIGGSYRVSGGDPEEAIQPDTVAASQESGIGVADAMPVMVDGLMYVQRHGRKLRSLAYAFELDGYKTPNRTVRADHVSQSGIVEMAYQAEPFGVMWVRRGDGRLVALTYEPDQQVLAWHEHKLGGSFDGGPPVVESVAVIPGDGYDEVWLRVKRTVNGETRRTLEVLEAPYEHGVTDPADAFFVDCGLTYDGAPATTISGLDHLEGETVSILADGAAHPDRVVADGEIELQKAAATVQVGLACPWRLVPHRPEGGSGLGTAYDKKKLVRRLWLQVLATLGVSTGPTASLQEPIPTREAGMAMDAPVPLRTGDFVVDFRGAWGVSGDFEISGSQPYPAEILAIVPDRIVEDR